MAIERHAARFHLIDERKQQRRANGYGKAMGFGFRCSVLSLENPVGDGPCRFSVRPVAAGRGFLALLMIYRVIAGGC